FPFTPPSADPAPPPPRQPGADPKAVRIDVTPLESTGPTNAEYLVIATVTDGTGQPRRGRRVEWAVEGTGYVAGVDETGIPPNRGRKADNQHAVSFTNSVEHTIKAADGREVTIRPGQTWCTVTAAVEGDAVVTVTDGDGARDRPAVRVTRHWCDADW